MDTSVAAALALSPESTVTDRTVDITTIGAHSGAPRRIEIWFHNIDGEVYLTGIPGPRDWYANLVTHPDFTFHLKNGVQTDLPAHAHPVSDKAERVRVFEAIVAGLDALGDRRGNPQRVPRAHEWVAQSPLVRVSFD